MPQSSIITVIAPNTCRALRKALCAWYDRARRDLSWRRTCDPYRIWVSEVMLQQTQVQTAQPYYERFIARFPDVTSLARADLQSVLKLWEGLGYYSRARNLHKAACIVAADLGGRIPSGWNELKRLPGIGDYIAAAVASIAFGKAHAVVDGNVKRVLARLFLVDVPINQSVAHNRFQALAQQLLDEHHPGDHNQAMMELGALICTPRAPECRQCPIRRFCKARQEGVVGLYPKKERRAALPTRRMAAGVMMKKGKILLVQRPAQGLLGGLWEFPCAELTEGLAPDGILAAYFRTALGLETIMDRRLEGITHVYTHFKLHMSVFLCRWQAGRVRLNGYTDFKWLPLSRIGRLPLHGAMHKALAGLQITAARANPESSDP